MENTNKVTALELEGTLSRLRTGPKLPQLVGIWSRRIRSGRASCTNFEWPLDFKVGLLVYVTTIATTRE